MVSRFRYISLLWLWLFFNATDSLAINFGSGGFGVSIQPIVGYEFTQVNTPTIHTRGMLIYGARVTAGYRWLSAEGEYTFGSENETFPGSDQNIKTQKQNLRLGARSTFNTAQWISLILRAGAQGTKEKIETTTISSGSTSTTTSDWELNPYAGGGLQIDLIDVVSLSLEATYLFRSFKDWSQNDVQTSAAFKIQLPTN